MKKRWICGFLAAVMLLGLLSGLTPVISATGSETTPATDPSESSPEATDPTESIPEDTDPTEPPPSETDPTEPPPEEGTPMTVSDDLIEVLKTMEGFSPVAYWDYSQWTIGYGTKCPEGKEHYYTVDNPFPEEEAEALLLEELSYFEEVIRQFAEKYSLELQQHQFDALVSFSYNCGGNWVNDVNGYFNKAVREGDMSNRLIYGMCLWSSAGGDYILIDRRKCEANMYIYGVYRAYNTTGGVPASIKHVFLDGNGGAPRYVIHGYNADDPAGIVTEFKTLPTGTDSSGKTFTYQFAGWYTAASGGTRVTVLDGSLSNGTVLYAHWKDPQGNVVTLPKGTVIDGVTVTVNASGKIRTGPGTYYPVVKTISAGETLTITETFQSGSTLWGKCEYGWISLYYTNYDEVISGGSTDPEDPEGQWGTVTTQSGGTVNVRCGPGTSYDVVGVKETGERVQIFARQSDGTREWGQMADGNWICLDYVVFDVTLQSISVASRPTKTQYVQRQDSLSLAGSALTLLYSDGSTETIGITADMVSGFSNEKLGDVTVTVTYQGKTTSFTVTVIKATVVFKNYDGTVLSSAQYAYGETVKIPADPTRPAEGDCIYRFTGWDKTVTACAGNAVYTAVYEAIQGQWGTVTTQSGGTVNVRCGPGTSYDVVGVKETGERVQIFARQSDGTREWGQMADGNWICLDYVSFDSASGSLTGDFDGSGAVNEDDAIYLLWHVMLPERYPADGNADVNADGNINEDDAIYLLWHVMLPERYPLYPTSN